MNVQVVQHRKMGLVNIAKSFIVDNRLAIDTGDTPSSADLILASLAENGGKPEELELIVLTHCHLDHVGGLKALAEKTGVEVASHRLEAEAVEASTGVKVTRLLEDGDVVDAVTGLRVIHAPGHTPGNICLIAGTSLFTGDSIFERRGRLTEPPKMFSTDSLQARASIQRLAELEVETLYLSHGKPVTRDARQMLRSLTE